MPKTLYSFLPSTEGGINARIADKVVWDGLTSLMTSPEQLLIQIESWLNSNREKSKSTVDNIEPLIKEITDLKDEESRYTKAYGKNLFTIEQLQEYVEPVKKRIARLEAQVAKAGEIERSSEMLNLPNETEIGSFAHEIAKNITGLSFGDKQGIVRSVIDKVVGNKEKLIVSGYIPIENINVKLNDRYGMNTPRHIDENKIIPFGFTLNLTQIDMVRRDQENL